MRVNILKYDDLGNGITYIDNKVCFVKKGVPGDEVLIEITKSNKNYCEANIKEIIKKSNLRVAPVCKYYELCGGCNFLHLKKSEELNFKTNRCLNFFNKLDYFYKTDDYKYRNKIVLHVKNGEYGFYMEKTNKIVKIDYCYLVKDKINDIIKIFHQNVDNNFSGSITIRVNNQDETLVSIIGNYKYVDILVDNNLVNNLIYNDKVIKGNDYFYEYIDNYKFKVHYKSFFQVNIKGLEVINKILKEFLNDKQINKALDLYSGTSVLGILISKYVNKVTSVESNTNASSDAKDNIKINNINNLEVINGLVENYIDKFQDIDLVILDPARRGLDKKTINCLKIIKSKYLIYIACGIDSLKRDLKLLNDTYNIEKLFGVDMFPNTKNTECVCVLKLK